MDSIDTLFTINPDANKTPSIDALHRTLAQADAIVHLLIGECSRPNDPVVTNALDAVSGHLAMIKEMVNYWYETEREART